MAASRVRIPKQFEAGLTKIISLPNEVFLEFMSALEQTPVAYSPNSIATQLVSKAKSLSVSDINDIMSLLISLSRLRDELNLSDSEFAEEMALALEDANNKELRLEGENRTRFKLRLTSLLNSQFLSIFAKIIILVSEHEHIFQEARISTDIRYVFLSQPEDQPKAAIIRQILKIGYIQEADSKEFYVAMDDGDISELISALERARKKAEALKLLLKTSDLPYVNAD